MYTNPHSHKHSGDMLSDEDLGKVARANLLRVFREAAVVAKRLQATEPPSSATIEQMGAGITKKRS